MVPTDFSFEKIYRKREEIVSRKIADEMFLVPVRGKLADMKQIFVLPQVAEFIWNDLDGKKSLGEISDNILANFAVGKRQAEDDLREFINELLEARLIEETN